MRNIRCCTMLIFDKICYTSVRGRNRLPKADRTFSGLRGRHFIKTVEETFHPEIDDIDSDFESSSSDSVSSVISVVVEDEPKGNSISDLFLIYLFCAVK